MNVQNPAKRRGAAEVASDIRKAIEGDVYRPHDRLPSERILSETHGVSRGTIRDALMRLEREGLVEIRAGSGTYVTSNDDLSGQKIIADARPLELIDTRFALEPHICRLSVLHAQEADFERLAALIQKMEENAHDRRVFSEADTEFHLELARSTGNSLLIWIITQINDVRSQDQWARMRRVTLDEQIIRTYNTQHRLILDALRNRNPERAAMLMKDHLETARRSLTRAAET
ncbi:MAG: FadR/GntR family transcriptional regulator [Pseudomonadota bacterium]